MGTRLLWVDDDCDGLLRPLERILEKKGHFTVKKAATFVDAMRLLKDNNAAINTRFGALLVDVILPEGPFGGSLASDLGVQFAEASISYGVSKIAFLTVVRQDEIIDRYVELERSHPEVSFSYFDKTTLLSKGEIEELVSRLNGNHNEKGASEDES